MADFDRPGPSPLPVGTPYSTQGCGCRWCWLASEGFRDPGPRPETREPPGNALLQNPTHNATSAE